MFPNYFRINKFLLFVFFTFALSPFLFAQSNKSCEGCPSNKKCDTSQIAQSQNGNDEFAPLNESEKSGSNEEEEFKPLDSSSNSVDTVSIQTINSESSIDSRWIVPLLALLFTIIAGIFVRFKATRNLRGIFLVASIVLLGFLNGACPCPISSFGNTVLAIWGSEFHWYQIIWFLGLIPITYIFGKVWCGWVCHLGALQELLYLPAKIKTIKSKTILKYINYFQVIITIAIGIHLCILVTNMFWHYFDYSVILSFKFFGINLIFTFVDFLWFLLLLILISFLLHHSEQLMKILRILFLIGFIFWLIGEDAYLFNKYDPFKTAFNLGYNANQTEWILLVLMLLSSIFLQRPFCKTACPIGLVLGWIARIPGASILGHNEKCNGCRLCSISCRNHAILRQAKYSILDNQECIGCGECIDACKLDSLNFYRKSSKRPAVITCKPEDQNPNN
jgi:polyferredoxin